MSIDVLHGNEAIEFAESKLKQVRVDSEAWTVEYVDEATGDRWLMDYPDGHLHGGGPPRLRRLG